MIKKYNPLPLNYSSSVRLVNFCQFLNEATSSLLQYNINDDHWNRDGERGEGAIYTVLSMKYVIFLGMEFWLLAHVNTRNKELRGNFHK